MGAQVKNKRARALLAPQSGTIDLWLLLVIILLTGIGVIMVFSASYYETVQSDPFYYLKKQGGFALGGFVIMALAYKFPYRIYRVLVGPMILALVGLLIAVFFFDPINGSQRWIPLGGFNLQPSEIAKFVVPVFLADQLSKKNMDINRINNDTMKILAVLAVLLGLIYKEPDLGTTIAVAGVAMAVLVAGGLKLRYIFSVGLAGLAGVIFMVLRTPYQMQRITGWLDPWSDPSDKGYQVINSLYAIGSGGFWGMGIGNSRQKLGFLPEQNTDFIFAITAEELGFIGASLIVILFMVLAWRGYRIAIKCKDPFGSLLAVGITTGLVLQAGLNLGVVTGTLPVTGIALPFISYGGSSLLMSLGAVGVLLNISKAY